MRKALNLKQEARRDWGMSYWYLRHFIENSPSWNVSMKISSDDKCLFLMMVIITMMVKVNLITYSRVSELPNCVWYSQFVLQSFRESFSKSEGFISHPERRETNLRSLLPLRNCIRLRSGRSQTFLGAFRRKNSRGLFFSKLSETMNRRKGY